jgi:asparagine synthase (glutamine-hydrolysing)
MCGIVGIIGCMDGMPVRQPLLKEMCDRIRHRGPDAEGYLMDDCVGLGVRRLKIIDLETGDQPIFNEDGSIGVVYNGEIFNFAQLREDLIRKGHVFKTHSDTEVIVHQYEEDGERCVESFRGMFAFALWDKRTKHLLLARDRFGVKPLFLAENAGRIAFASEMKALQPVPGVNWSWSAPGLRAYLQMGYIPCPMTAYSGIRKFEQGSTEMWQIDGDGRVDFLSRRKYWQPAQPSGGLQPPFEQAAEQLLMLLKESVRLRLRSDVPLGAFLSGGLDSSSVVALMRLCNAEDIQTFSIGFEESAYNEMPYADLVARHFNTEHHTHIVTGIEAKKILPVIAGYDEPFADSSAIPTYFVSKLAREHVTVSLSGDGGDELFAGYWHYHRLARLRHLQRWPTLLRRISSAIGTGIIPSGRHEFDFFQNLGRPRNEHYLALATSPSAGMLFNALSPKMREFLRSEPADQESIWFQTFSAVASQSDAQLADQKFFLADDILVKVDRSSMAVSLESREPFLESQVAEFANRLPSVYHRQGRVDKRLLRHCMKPYLPKEILQRKKMGFCVPLRSWLIGPLANDVREQLLPDSGGLFCQAGIQQLLKLVEKPWPSASSNLWRMFCLALWASVNKP